MFFGGVLLVILGACGSPGASEATQTTTMVAPQTGSAARVSQPASATPTPRVIATPRNAKPLPTVLKNAPRIPVTHDGRTQCLTCHEFGNVGPPMPPYHKDDHYDNTMCKRCHNGP